MHIKSGIRFGTLNLKTLTTELEFSDCRDINDPVYRLTANRTFLSLREQYIAQTNQFSFPFLLFSAVRMYLRVQDNVMHSRLT